MTRKTTVLIVTYSISAILGGWLGYELARYYMSGPRVQEIERNGINLKVTYTIP